MDSDLIFPWFHPIWQGLALDSQESFPHGIIFSGLPGIGKQHFAELVIQSLLCLNTGQGEDEKHNLACNHCRACNLYASGANADYRELVLLEGKTQIGIEQVRDSITWVNSTHQFNAKKVLFVSQAELMTVQAANSLLKTLEEPPADTIIILLVEHIESLIPTIRSRCRMIHLPEPERHVAKQWLQGQEGLQGKSLDCLDNATVPDGDNSAKVDLDLLLDICFNAPLKVLALANGEELQQRQLIIEQILAIMDKQQDPLLVAKNLEKLEAKNVIFWFYALVMDMIRCKNQVALTFIMNKDYLQQYQAISDSVDLLLLDQLYGDLNKYYQQRSSQLNQQLLLESLLIKWRNCRSVL